MPELVLNKAVLVILNLASSRETRQPQFSSISINQPQPLTAYLIHPATQSPLGVTPEYYD